MTLIEVLIALAIFLLAMVVFGEMILRNKDIALEIQRQNLATRLCQSKLHEAAAGVVPMTGQDDTPFEEEPDYTWSMTADAGSVVNLWNVAITVKRRQTDSGAPVQCVLTQMMLDPSVAGSTQDVPAAPITSASAGTSGTSSSSTPAATPAAATPAAATPAAATPKPTTPAATTPKATSTPKGT